MRRAAILAGRRPRDPGLVVVLAAAALLFVAYALWAWQRHRWYLTAGYDLGIFDQATRNLASGREPASSLREVPNLWGDHFHPIIVLWGGLRAIWPSPVALLVSQAALVAIAMVPLYLLARDRAGRGAGVLIALAYGSSWGVQRAIDFDVHELAFAPVLLATAVLMADRRRWRWFWVSLVLLLCVKEDVSLLVVAIGLWLALEGERRRGAVAIVAGLAWFVLATRWWIPGLGVQEFTYWSYYRFGDDAPSAIVAAITHPWRLVTVAIDPAEKVETLALLLLPFAMVTPWLTRLAILPLPLLAERFLSDQSVYWGTSFHYSLLPTMALAIAAAGGVATVRRALERRAARIPEGPGRSRWSAAARRAPLALAAAGLLGGTVAWYPAFDAGASPEGPPLLAMATLHQPPREVDRHLLDRVVAAVPGSGSIAAPTRLQPHLTGRDQPVHLLENRDPGTPSHVTTDDNVVFDLTDPEADVVGRADLLAPTVDLLDRRLDGGGLVPVRSFAEGWVVLRSPRAAGGAVRDPGLGAVTGPAGAAARRAAAAWSRALSRTAPECGAVCSPSAAAHLQRAAAELDAAMRAAGAASPGTCAGILRGLAPSATRLLTLRAATFTSPGDATVRALYDTAVNQRLARAARRGLVVCAPSSATDPAAGMPAGPVAPGLPG